MIIDHRCHEGLEVYNLLPSCLLMSFATAISEMYAALAANLPFPDSVIVLIIATSFVSAVILPLNLVYS